MAIINVRGNNVYRNGRLIEFEDDESMLIRTKVEFTSKVGDGYYKVRTEDTIDMIAWAKYKDEVEDASKYWWVIADANNIHDPLDLSDFIGTDILIPSILDTLLVMDT